MRKQQETIRAVCACQTIYSDFEACDMHESDVGCISRSEKKSLFFSQKSLTALFKCQVSLNKCSVFYSGQNSDWPATFFYKLQLSNGVFCTVLDSDKKRLPSFSVNISQ